MSNLINSRKQHSDESNFIPPQWSELQQALEKERNNRSQLQMQLSKIKEELDEAREKGMLLVIKLTSTVEDYLNGERVILMCTQECSWTCKMSPVKVSLNKI